MAQEQGAGLMDIIYKIGQWVWLTHEMTLLGFPHTARVVGISPDETAQYTVQFRDGSYRRIHRNQIANEV